MSYSNKILFRSRLQRYPEKIMKTTEIPKKTSNIETALAKAFSNILPSPRNPYPPALKSKVSKIEMNLNYSILSKMIYADADTNIL